jgi:hypothetical protein
MAGAAILLSLREPWLALLGLPALCFAPGWALASRLNRGEEGHASLLGTAVDAFWLSVPAAMGGWALARVTGLGGWAVLAVVAAGAVFGELWARRAAPTRYTASRGERWALVGGATLLAVWFTLSATTIARPLDRYWYLAEVEERLPETGASPAPGDGWREVTPIGAAEDGLLRLRPVGPEAVLSGGSEGSPRAFLLHGPVGASVSGLGVGRLTVEASPVERNEEGAVWRYRDAGVAGRIVELPAEGATLRFSHPADSRLYVLSNRDSIWTLDGSGELRFVHYYQLLNMVEQLVWAEERWVTDVQPPLGTWVLGPAVAFTGGGQPTANVLLLYVLALSVAAMTRLVHRHAPEAPLPAWLLPGAAAAVTGKLLLEPGSAGMPDALYASAVVAALAGRGEAYMLAAQLLRYPGSAVVALGLLLGGETRKAVRGMVGVVLAAAAFGAGGAVTGALDGWLATVAWESGPEHWGDDYAASSLLPRAPGFYLTWLIYAGATPLLALLNPGRGVRVALGTALIYSGLLATIHHHPTHYFLPLVQLGACACACASAPAGSALSRVRGTVVSTLGVLGLLIFLFWGQIRG